MLLAFAVIAVFAAFVLIGRRKQRGRRSWRIGAGLLSLGAFTGAVVTAVRGDWIVAAVLALAGLLVSFETRARDSDPKPQAKTPTSDKLMTDAQARAVLGVDADAGADEIQDAYRRLMRAVHPDLGGSSVLAAQLNAARDRLLGKA
jgi:hypothetical protein